MRERNEGDGNGWSYPEYEITEAGTHPDLAVGDVVCIPQYNFREAMANLFKRPLPGLKAYGRASAWFFKSTAAQQVERMFKWDDEPEPIRFKRPLIVSRRWHINSLQVLERTRYKEKRGAYKARLKLKREIRYMVLPEKPPNRPKKHTVKKRA